MTIENAYRGLAAMIGEESIEPLAVAVEVERLRQLWRPDEVRVVLLAESHVWTSAKEAQCRVRVPGQSETGYVRFVYCLGYGEPSVVSPGVAKKSGTPQYWRLFHDCLDGPGVSAEDITKKQRNTLRRIRAKLQLLERMRDAGLWLVDASVTALYNYGRKLVKGRAYRDALAASWDAYVGKVVAECRPGAILVVGQGVGNALSGRVQGAATGAGIEVISQPNARLSAADREAERRQCYEFCSRHLRIARLFGSAS